MALSQDHLQAWLRAIECEREEFLSAVMPSDSSRELVRLHREMLDRVFSNPKLLEGVYSKREEPPAGVNGSQANGFWEEPRIPYPDDGSSW